MVIVENPTATETIKGQTGGFPGCGCKLLITMVTTACVAQVSWPAWQHIFWYQNQTDVQQSEFLLGILFSVFDCILVKIGNISNPCILSSCPLKYCHSILSIIRKEMDPVDNFVLRRFADYQEPFVHVGTIQSWLLSVFQTQSLNQCQGSSTYFEVQETFFSMVFSISFGQSISSFQNRSLTLLMSENSWKLNLFFMICLKSSQRASGQVCPASPVPGV